MSLLVSLLLVLVAAEPGLVQYPSKWRFFELLFLPLAVLPIISGSTKVFLKEKLSCKEKTAEEADVISTAKQRSISFAAQYSAGRARLLWAPACSSAAHTYLRCAEGTKLPKMQNAANLLWVFSWTGRKSGDWLINYKYGLRKIFSLTIVSNEKD